MFRTCTREGGGDAASVIEVASARLRVLFTAGIVEEVAIDEVLPDHGTLPLAALLSFASSARQVSAVCRHWSNGNDSEASCQASVIPSWDVHHAPDTRQLESIDVWPPGTLICF